MISVIDKVIISLLLFTNFLFADVLKITLNSGDEFNNCRNLKIEDDSLHISLLLNDNLNQMILIGNIKSIITISDSHITKYEFTDMSINQQIKALRKIIDPDIYQSTSKTPIVPELYSDKSHLVLLISIIVLISMITGTVLVMKLIKKKRKDETIHGAKEMVETMLMWAKRHRDEASKY